MPIDFRRVYSADAIEGLVSATGPLDHADTRAANYARRAERAGRACGVERESVLHALRVAVVRMAMRYGSLSDDWHAHHNDEVGVDEAELRLQLRLAIIGSTFDTDKQDTEHGAFAHRLGVWLDGALIGWRGDANALRACVTSRALRERFSAVIDAPSGHAVLAAFREIASA